MQTKLKKLMDYQLFEANDNLQKLISETESRYINNSLNELTDDEMGWVNAAGDITPKTKKDR